jgi:hypothetical protein
MSLDYHPSPGETATPCRADYIFGEYLGQCVAELSVEYGNLSEVAHSPNSHRSKKALRHCTNFIAATTLGQNSANFHLGLCGASLAAIRFDKIPLKPLSPEDRFDSLTRFNALALQKETLHHNPCVGAPLRRGTLGPIDEYATSVRIGPRWESNHGQNREPHSTVGAGRIAGNDMAGLGKLPDSYYNSMECFRRVGSHNPLNFLNCHIPSTGTIPQLCL